MSHINTSSTTRHIFLTRCRWSVPYLDPHKPSKRNPKTRHPLITGQNRQSWSNLCSISPGDPCSRHFPFWWRIQMIRRWDFGLRRRVVDGWWRVWNLARFAKELSCNFAAIMCYICGTAAKEDLCQWHVITRPYTYIYTRVHISPPFIYNSHTPLTGLHIMSGRSQTEHVTLLYILHGNRAQRIRHHHHEIYIPAEPKRDET